MGTLQELLTTGEGCDLIAICQGEFFFVHKAVICPQSPVLNSKACASQFLNGEAYLVTDIPPTVFRKILSFLYRGDISQFPELPSPKELLYAVPSAEYFARTFPCTDQFLTTVIGKPAPESTNSDLPAGADMVSNPRKWSLLAKKQLLLMKDLYDGKDCNGPADVLLEVEIFAGAVQLDIAALKEWTMKKVLAWFEKELQLGLPVSENLCKVADIVLRKEKAFVKPFFSLYAKFFSTLGMNLAISRLMKDLDRDSFDMFAQLHSQWTTERKRLDEELEQGVQKATALEAEIASLKSQSTASEKAYKTELEHLKETLKATQAKELSSTAKAELLENMNKSLQMDLLMSRVSKLQAKENTSPKVERLPPKTNTTAEDLEKLKQQLAGVQDALKQHKAAHKNIKNDLIKENEKLKEKLDYLKCAFDIFMEDVNKSGRCRGCKRQWNFTIDHDKYTAIKMSCKLCHREGWYYED